MPDFGKFRLNSQLDAGELLLFALTGDDVTRRVYLGVRTTARDCGLLRLYSGSVDFPVLDLYATPFRNARLTLKSQLPGGELFTAVQVGAYGADDPRWGWLQLQAVNADGQAGPIVTIGTDDDRQRGSIHLGDAADGTGAGFAILEVDSNGPYLFMSDGDHAISISPRFGLTALPAKVGEWNFAADHPTDPARQIYYNVLEGPEVGVYVRGTARLEAGRALVALPEHLGHVACETGLTVQLTPRAAESEGVAAVRLTLRELELQELRGGSGSYDVDFLVHGVRRGHEDFQVLRERNTGAMRGAARSRPRRTPEGDEGE